MFERRANLFPVNENTLLLTYDDEYGEGIRKEFKVDDPMSPLEMKTFLQLNQIDGCDYYIQENEEWHGDIMERFIENAREIFEMEGQTIQSGLLN
jgi:hypothetical protein|tara:strand:+ start:351 stop:635 length:285 start_codon:yes stop_codon:yes gene_type:complete